MFKNLASICAALIIAAAAFSTPAQAQRHYGGAAHFSGARTGISHFGGYGGRYYGGYGGRYYGGRYYGGGWGYYGGGLAAGAILGGLLATAPYYGDGYGYGDYGYGYGAPVYVEPGPGYYYYGSGMNCAGVSPASPNFGACN